MGLFRPKRSADPFAFWTVGSIGFEYPVEFFRGEVFKWFAVLHPGVVDQDIDGSQVPLAGIDCLANGGCVRDVECTGLDGCPTLPQLIGCGRQPTGIAPVQDQPRPGLRQAPRQSKTDPR